MRSEYNPYEKLPLARASRVKANEHILESLELARKLEESINKHNRLFHSKCDEIITSVTALIDNLEEEYNYNIKIIQNIDKYLQCGQWDGNESSFREELVKSIQRY